MSAVVASTRPWTVGRTVARGTLIGTGLALLGAFAVYGFGRLTTPFRVVSGWSPEGAEVSAVEIAVTVVVAMAAGGLLLAALARWRAEPLRPWIGTVAAVAVLSAVPLWHLDLDTRSKVALSLMHLLTGVAAVAGQVLARRYPAP